MTMKYIRGYYGVPAERGRRVRFNYLGSKEGTIVGTSHSHLKVMLDGDTRAVRLHPTWNLEYLEADPLPDGVLVTPTGKLVVEW